MGWTLKDADERSAPARDFCHHLCISDGTCINPNLTSIVNQKWCANGKAVQPHTYTFTCGNVLLDGQ